MKKEWKRMRQWATLLLFFGLMVGGFVLTSTVSADTNLDEANFPDESFRSYLKRQFDVNNDGVLSTQEMQAITKLNVSKRNVKDVKGIEWFGNLQVLECDDNGISALDVSKNRELTYLDCSGNNIEELNVSENGKLKTLICYSNGMKTLNIGKSGVLETLDCSNNRLYTLQTGDQVNVTSLNLSGNQLLGLDLTMNQELEELVCNRNFIKTLDLTGNKKLIELTCSRNGLTSIALPETGTLARVNCSDNQLNALDVSANTGLRTLNCSDNRITQLQLSQAEKLEVLNCADNRMTSLDLSNNEGLLTLDCRNNRLGFLNLDDNEALSTVKASGNERDVYIKDNNRIIDESNLTGLDITKIHRDSVKNMEFLNAEITYLTAISNEAIQFSYQMAEGKSETFQWNPVTTKQISLFHTDATMTVGDRLRLTAELLGGEGEITYASSNDSVVKVENDGTLSALTAGEATITASANGFQSVTCKVAVLENIRTLTISEIPAQTLVDGGVTPTVVVTCNGKTLTGGTDYDVTYIGNDKVGTAIAIITGKGYYEFEVIKEFMIRKDVGKVVADEIAGQAYTGKEIIPPVVLREGNVILKQDTDYTVTYANNKNPGTAIVTIKGIGDYSGEKLMTFNIKIPQVANLVKTGNKLKQIKLTWNKVENVDGYRVYKYNATAKKYERLATVKGNDVVTYTDTNCVSGTAYRYRVRAMVNIGGTNVFGAYSKVIKTACKLSKPTLTVTSGKAGTRQANLKWNKIKGSSGYRVYMKEGKTGAYKRVKSLSKAATKKYTKASLTRGKTYYFKIRAYKTVNGVKIFGKYSNEKKVTIK